MKIAFITKGRVDDPLNWSGIVKRFHDTLVDNGHQVIPIDGISRSPGLVSRLWGRWVRLSSGRLYHYDRELLVAAKFGRQVTEKLGRTKADHVVVTLAYTAAFLKTNLPVGVWDDGSFHSLHGLYPHLQNLAPNSLWQANKVEKLGIDKATMLAYASNWAAQTAIDYYGAGSEKVVVIPFGASCRSPFGSAHEAASAVKARLNLPFRILFVGYDWHRKGGPLVLDSLFELQKRGVDAELTVVGCDPFSGKPPKGVHCLGRLDKSKPAELGLWQQSFLESHVFFMPTRAECFGIVYAEAAAHALPSVATAVGGVPDAIHDGVTGRLLDLDATPQMYADVLERFARDENMRHNFSMAAYRFYLEKLNWTRAVSDFTEHLASRGRTRGLAQN